MMNNREKRYIPANGSIRAKKTDDGKVEVTGMPIVFNERSKLINDWDGQYYETISASATDYAFSRGDNDIILTFNHKYDELPLARYTASEKDNTLSYDVKDDGVHMTAILNTNRSDVNDVVEAINDKVIRAHSFIFTVKEDKWERLTEDDEEFDLRTILTFNQVFEFSFVTNPAYEGAEIDKRTHDAFVKEQEKKDEPTEEAHDVDMLRLNIFIEENK